MEMEDPEVVESADPPPPTEDRLAAIEAALERLAERQERSERTLLARFAIADELNEEVQRLRRGEFVQAVMPLLTSVIRLADDLRAAAGRPDADPQLATFSALAEDVLADAGVRAYSALDDEPFDARRHKIVGTVPTSEPERARRVAATVRPGLEREDGSPVRRADVHVFSHQPENAE
jgi:molecular chaperone GrpE (heat shock protein)